MPQLNFPSIGYHNMKENEYISMAKNILKTKNMLSRDVYFYHAFDGKTDFELYPQVPFVAYQILLGYKLFGDILWFPRLINVVYMLLSIACIFYLVYMLTGEYHLSIAAMFLSAVMPLGVYFSRNLQPESGAFFFMCLGNILWLKFTDNFRRPYLIGFALSFVMTAAYKLAFLIGFAPLLFLLPYRRYLSERRIRGLLLDLAIFVLPCMLFIGYCKITGQSSFSSCENRVNLFSVFTQLYWQKNGMGIWDYMVKENFTSIYFILSITGMLWAWRGYRTDRSLFALYLRSWSLVILPYCMVFNDFINQHNYYQMPFLGFVVLVSIYAIKELNSFVSDYLKTQAVSRCFALVFVVIFLFSSSSIRNAILEHYNVVFTGADVVGQFLKDNTNKEEKFFMYTFAQGYAPCVYAERKCGYPASLKEFKKVESDFSIRFIAFYPIVMLDSLPAEMRNYITNTYHVRMLGFNSPISEMMPRIMVLEKGGTVDIAVFMRQNQKNLRLSRVYQTINQELPFYTMVDE